MYGKDSFHTLTGAGQIGLVALSVVLSAALLWIGWQVMGRRRFPVRLGVALGLFFAFVWLSPQAYYTYYLTLFDGLPWQNVIKSPPGPESLLKILSFRGPQTLSAHSLGILGWALILMAVFKPKAASEPPPDDRV